MVLQLWCSINKSRYRENNDLNIKYGFWNLYEKLEKKEEIKECYFNVI